MFSVFVGSTHGEETMHVCRGLGDKILVHLLANVELTSVHRMKNFRWMLFFMFGLDASILYIKATVASLCLSLCLFGQCLENSSRHCPFPVVCFVEGGGAGFVSMCVCDSYYPTDN
jgi:hypothetical protein